MGQSNRHDRYIQRCPPPKHKMSLSTEPLLLHHGPSPPPQDYHVVDCSGAMAAAAPPTRMCIDEVLSQHAGEFGAWQLRHFVLTSTAWALEAVHTMVMIFADQEPAWRCLDPKGCSADYICDPKGQGSTWEWVGGGAAASSTVAQWGLVCADKYKVGLVQAAFFAGCMLGAGVFGHLSDSFVGRKGSLTVVCVLNLIFGALTALSPTYWIYLLLRLLTGFSTGGVGLCAFVLATEPVGPSRRGVAGMSTFYFFSSGIAALCGVAYLAHPWRMLYLVTSLPSLLFLVLIVPFLTESPRWYLVRGRAKEAMDVMRAIAAGNGRKIPDDVTLVLDEDNNNNTDDDGEEDGRKETAENSGSSDDDVISKPPLPAASGSVLDAIRSPLTRTRLILMVFINLLCSVVYYGLSLNVTNLKTNLYLSVLLNAVAEMPAFLLTALLLDRLGRKPLSVATMWISGASCLAGTLLPVQGYFKALRVACGVAGIFGMAATYNLLFIYTAELFPTVVRNAALGCATQAAQLGAILAPFIVVTGERIPFAVFGACGIAGGLLAFYLPETKDKPLYDTMAGMEGGEYQISKAEKQNGC